MASVSDTPLGQHLTPVFLNFKLKRGAKETRFLGALIGYPLAHMRPRVFARTLALTRNPLRVARGARARDPRFAPYTLIRSKK